MSQPNESEIIYVDITSGVPQKNKPTPGTIIKHVLLFIATFASVAVMGGVFFVGHTAGAESITDLVLWEGVLFAFLLLLFLGVHEFGHYFAAVYHRVSASLPYFIPLPLVSPIGTLGAVIKIKERINDTIKLYDIGISGPLAGFVVALGILLYGFATLPGPEFLNNFEQHEEIVDYVLQHGSFPEDPIAPEGSELIFFGETLLYTAIASFYDNAPPMWEMYHYPFLLAGWLGLFFTALNLMPVGQLDGGHILYALIGFKRHQMVARAFFGLVVTFAGFALLPLLDALSARFIGSGFSFGWILWALLSFGVFRKAYFGHQGWTLWVWLISLAVNTVIWNLTGDTSFGSGYGVWVMFTLFILYFVKIEHPPVYYEQELDPVRKVLGWLTMLIFILCISPTPIFIQ
ncbi:MAG: site-2 protease family protein [Balneolales bacterium]|nr:site-2 protease family protein [Balneolales bacterium]